MARQSRTTRHPGAAVLRRAYRLMRVRFGHQRWWPGETPFEVCVGAILTQNTAWTNVERAIANLKSARVLDPRKLFALPGRRLAQLIRPAGYFNVKARRLRSFMRVLVEQFGGDLRRLFAGQTRRVRERLLAIHGIGPETADSLLLYAGGHASFVIDAYTKRIFQRHGWAGKSGKRKVKGGKTRETGYEELKSVCEGALNQNSGRQRLDYWQDYHAQLVAVGKHFCRTRAPRCSECPLKPLLPADGKAVEALKR
ncbi:MAG: endonuclease III domain-containing protein [Verrucomicrobiota bacterium]|nr:endonuclease III domain-containing protein [Verrucomicrobiota bacterium]